MGDLELLLRHWRALDALFDRIDLTPWGAVVSDPRFPGVQEANYARVEGTEPVALAEIDREMLPALARSGATHAHVVVFAPERQTDLVAEASMRGERIVWDLVMACERPSDPAPGNDAAGGRVEEVHTFDDALWSAHRESARHFDVSDEDVLDQLSAMEREVLVPAGRRWFVVRDAGAGAAAFAALLVLEGVGFLDHVVTLPIARRRGHATALTRRAVAEAHAAGAERTYLLAEPDAPAVELYARLGFERVGHLASWVSPIGR